MELTIIAPMYNEESNVESTFYSIKEVFDKSGIDWELLFVNDGSIDNTLNRAKELEKKEPRLKVLGYPVNAGAGRALREGFKAASGRYVISVDFDLSYSPDQILKLYQKLASDPYIDAVLGSCYMPGGRVEGVDPYRLFVSWLGNMVLSAVFGGRARTITCVFRGYKREVIQGLKLQLDKKDIHLEILAGLIGQKRKISEIPATLRLRSKGKSKFKLWKTSRSHLKFIFSYLSGKYKNT